MSAGPRFPAPGHHTAYGGVLDYRLGKVEQLAGISGRWLDVGCADGYYSVALAERGAASVVGTEITAELVARANALPHPDSVTFVETAGDTLPFEAASFDCVLLNEVMEHVTDERLTVAEIARVLRPGGTLVLFSPSRWFPFEGHGARWSEERTLVDRPVPLMPWLPKRVTNRFATARNYWPHELARLVTDAGMQIVARDWALAQFEQYPWIPGPLARWYRSNLTRVEHSPVARFLAVSAMIVARTPSSGGGS